MLGRAMESEMRQQPALLSQSRQAYSSRLKESLSGLAPEMVLLAARGSSDNAALFARYLIEIYLGIPSILAAPSVLTRYGAHVRYPRTLAIGISQSGAAPDVSEVLRDMRSQGHVTLAITNTPDSRITRAAEFSLLLDVGTEKSVAATKTYTASLLALYSVVQALGAALPEPELPNDDWMSLCEDRAGIDHEILSDDRNLFTLARGIRFCSADETALKLMECALLHCQSYSTADFEHGPRALATEKSAAIVFGERPETLQDRSFEVRSAPHRAEVPEPSLPLWDAIYAQWLALLAARARGLDPDHPDGLKKVTQTR